MNAVIIDGNNLFYRYFYSKRNLSDSSGIVGIMQALNTYSDDSNRTYIVWDGDREKKRLKIYPEYKQHRDDTSKHQDKPEILRQIKIAQKFISCLCVKQLVVPDMEADDVIAILCSLLEDKKIIVSSDSDFIQLISEQVQLCLVPDNRLLNHKNINGYLGYPQSKYVLWKSMVGDKSDNIKGVHGIGPVKATKAILENKILSEWREIIRRNKLLLTTGIFATQEQKTFIKDWIYKPVKSDMAKLKALLMGEGLEYYFEDWKQFFQ